MWAEGAKVKDVAAFSAFVAAHQRSLQRTAWLLTGDWALAEDLVQTALAKTWTRWSHVLRDDAPEVYVRRVMLNTHATLRRRRWRGELPAEYFPDVADATATDDHEVVERLRVRAALGALPSRQRAVVVLRYFDDLSEKQVASILGCSVGTVKSQASRALAKLRVHPALALDLRRQEAS